MGTASFCEQDGRRITYSHMNSQAFFHFPSPLSINFFTASGGRGGFLDGAWLRVELIFWPELA
jgi:hypothetical protein